MAFKTVLADPPWRYGDSLRMGEVKRSAQDQYHTMSTDEICRLAVDVDVTSFKDPHDVFMRAILGHFVEPTAVLWLWVTNPFLLNGDGPRVCRAWGFEPKQIFTWVKGTVKDDAIVGPLGMGHYLRVDTEHLILATRGQATALVQNHSSHNYTLVAPKTRHSQKPEEIYALIEGLTPGPYLELFARQKREGWTSVGDQLTP